MLSGDGGRRSGLVGKVGGARTTWVNTAGSSRVQARCCYSASYLSITSETDHQKSRDPPPISWPHIYAVQPYVHSCCSHFFPQVRGILGHHAWNFENPLLWAGGWFAPMRPGHYITQRSLHRAPRVKVTWWMTGQSDRLSAAARHRCPGDGNLGGTEQKIGTETEERGEAKANATGCWEEGLTFIAKLVFCVQSLTLNRNMKRCE